MSERRLVDTNVVVRYLVQDHAPHARAASRLFEAGDRGEVTLVLLPAVVAECVFVLESFYQHSRPDIARVLGHLISSRGVEMAETAIHVEALDRYRKTKMHFVDCLIAATAASGKIPVASLDKEFSRFPDVRVAVEP